MFPPFFISEWLPFSCSSAVWFSGVLFFGLTILFPALFRRKGWYFFCFHSDQISGKNFLVFRWEQGAENRRQIDKSIVQAARRSGVVKTYFSDFIFLEGIMWSLHTPTENLRPLQSHPRGGGSIKPAGKLPPSDRYAMAENRKKIRKPLLDDLGHRFEEVFLIWLCVVFFIFLQHYKFLAKFLSGFWNYT